MCRFKIIVWNKNSELQLWSIYFEKEIKTGIPDIN